MNAMKIQIPAQRIQETCRRTSLLRWLTFNTVGLLGVVVQLFFLTMMREWLGLHYLAATALAVEIAILHNFVWHERWTWFDRVGRDPAGRLRRLLRFNLASGTVSIASNVVFTALLVSGYGLHYLPANLLAISAGSVLNFVASEHLVFSLEASSSGGLILLLLRHPETGGVK